MCRSRRELSNAYLLAKIGVDTAENEPLKVWGENSIHYSLHSLILTLYKYRTGIIRKVPPALVHFLRGPFSRERTSAESCVLSEALRFGQGARFLLATRLHFAAKREREILSKGPENSRLFARPDRWSFMVHG